MCAIKTSFLKGIFAVFVAFMLVLSIFNKSFNVEQVLGGIVLIDEDGPHSAWGKSIGDIDGDGDFDFLVGGHAAQYPDLFSRLLVKLKLQEWPRLGGQLVWYENPGWQKHLISDQFKIRTDLEVGDINLDGVNDVVALTDSGVMLFYGPDWRPELINTQVMHDIELADLDQDGDLDLVLRDQRLFGHDRGHELFIYWQEGQGQWKKQKQIIESGEGLKVADINGDSFSDIVVNGDVLLNPGSQGSPVWEKLHYAGDWQWPDVYIDVKDINADKLPDIVLSPSEPAHKVYRISWFQNPGKKADWLEHVVDDVVEAVHHFVGAGDYEGDGDIDIFSAEMNQGEGKNSVKVYLNDGSHLAWEKKVLSDKGSHSMRVADFDGDFDAEVVGANWHIKDYEGPYRVSMWGADSSKQLSPMQNSSKQAWRRTVIGAHDPYRSLFVLTGDLDGDGFVDVTAGGRWYKNPGKLNQSWLSSPLGEGLNNVVLLKDFDEDGLVDVLASHWDGLISSPDIFVRAKHKLLGKAYPGSLPGTRFSWGKNKGLGSFEVFNNIGLAQGDYLQGAGLLKTVKGEKVVLSWHKNGVGVQTLSIPKEPTQGIWNVKKVSAVSQDEQVSMADINQDGLDDIVLGNIWLDQAKNWAATSIADNMEKPDRNRIADFNLDGWPDILVGEEAVNKLGRVLWYENPKVAGGKWLEHAVGEFYGPMSLEVSDMDGDQDLDIIVGEHRLKHPEQARLIEIENLDGRGGRWLPKLVYKGDEHHDGVQVVDLDKDGDKDIVSIGWGHSKVIVYENLTADLKQ